MSNIKPEELDEILQAIAELSEEIKHSEVIEYVARKVKIGISCQRQNHLEEALQAFNEALSHISKVRARQLEYQIFMRVKSIYYELGRPADELNYFYR